MNKLLITNARIYTPLHPVFTGWLLAEDKKIFSFSKGQPSAELAAAADRTIDAGGKALLPGFIDIHTHGGLGYCTMDADPVRLRAIAERNAQHGVTGFLPTTLTARHKPTVAAIEAVTSMIGERGKGSKIFGVHLEGPYFNPVKAGAQDPNSIRRADPKEVRDFIRAGKIRLIAMAPEYPENLAAGDIFAAEGITVSAGHTDSNYVHLVEAAKHGFSLVTHLFNGMKAFSHREPGTIGGALTLDDYTVEMICDNVHSHPAAQNLAYRAKGSRGIILITDCIRPSGLPDGTYPFAGTVSVTVSENGTNLRLPGGNLAGSALTMDRALRNFSANTGASLDEIWRCSSLNAAIKIGVSGETGSIEKGKLADLVLMTDEFDVTHTIIDGQVVYER